MLVWTHLRAQAGSLRSPFLDPKRAQKPRLNLRTVMAPLLDARRRGKSLPPDEPILAELFSVERLEQHARTLAVAQTVTDTPYRGPDILPRVAENGRILLEAYRVLASAIKEERSITPAAEWLVDNFHVVDEQVREIRDDLPHDYYWKLPKLAEGHLEGYPRVLGLAWAYIAHTDSRFDPDSLLRMVRAYQQVQPLTLGELWAIAISLRILLVDNLRRLAEQIVRSRAARQQADEIADGLLGLTEGTSEDTAAFLRRRPGAYLPTAAKVQLFQRMRDQDPAQTPGLRWLETVVAAEGTTAEEMVRLEHQRQATMNVTVRNVITSMRLISWFDWAQFVESVSLVDGELRASGLFAEMDFATRDRYRHAIEELAQGSRKGEVEVARAAVAMAGAAPVDAATPSVAARLRDPGYYLVSDGRPEFERHIGVRVPFRWRLRRAFVCRATGGYLGTLAASTALIVAAPLLLSGVADGVHLGALLVALFALGPASDLAMALVNRAVTSLL
ncbi:MAG TPA: hypothetical protein VHM66_07500, partial [Solirubrobacterales bacterium]|nr:hypothetical protein [Solirubrobacterales bacterium]